MSRRAGGNLFRSGFLRPDSVDTQELVDLAVTNSKVAPDAITSVELEALDDTVQDSTHVFSSEKINDEILARAKGTYPIFNEETGIFDAPSSFTKICSFPWDDSRYSEFTNGICIVFSQRYTTVGGGTNTLAIRLFDKNNATQLGIFNVADNIGPVLDSIITFTFNNPVSDTLIELQARASGVAATLEINSATLEWDR